MTPLTRTVLIGVAVALVAGGIVFATSKDGGDKKQATPGGEIILESVGVATPSPFTASVAAPEKRLASVVTAPLATQPMASTTTKPGTALVTAVSGASPGLYGGTRDMASCDAEAMISFLGDDSSKAKAWADAQGIKPADIPTFVRSLTPVVLVRDTRVTNNGYKNGRATPHQSVLQAGTAVLVDRFGVPRAKCFCGNPLAPPAPVQTTPVYTGTKWPEFAPENIVVVNVDIAITQFVLIDVDGGEPFARPSGSSGVDLPITLDDLCSALPAYPDCAEPPTESTTSSTTAPDTSVEPVILFEIGNIGGVSSGPTAPSIAVFDRETRITKITDYHWNGASGAPTGTIALRGDDGTIYGPWQTTGSDGQGGVPSAYWHAEIDLTLPAGSYEIIDSDPATWSQNYESAGLGFVVIYGY